MRRWLTYTALLVTVLFWGSSFVATKIALASMRPATYMFLRFAVASLLFTGVLAVSGRLSVPRALQPRIALMALFEPGLYFFFETAGLERTSASTASLIISAVPAVVALASWLILKERVETRAWIGIATSMVGVAALVLADSRSGGTNGSLLGSVLVLFAVFSAAGYMIVARSLAGHIDALQLSAYQTLYGTVYFAPLFLIRSSFGAIGDIRTDGWIAIAFLVLAATLAAFLAYNYALTQIPAARAAVFLNGIPVVSAVLGVIVLGERLTAIQIAGGVLVLAGVTVTVRVRRRPPAAAPQPPV